MIFLTLVVKKNIKSNKINMEHSRLFREQRYLGDIARDSKYAKEIRVFQLTNWINSKKIKVIKELICLTKKISKYTLVLEVVDIVYQLVRDYFMYIVLIILYFNHKITIAEIASFSVLVMQLNANLSLLSVNFESMFNQFSSLDLLFEYLEIEKEPVGVSSNKKSEDWSITFDSVSFHYPNNDYLIFENLSFTIEKGKKIAIIGLNGVGKTTLIKLLMRLYKPTSGRILINGTNIEEFKPGDYYCLFAPVFQEMNLFPFTFFENLTFRDDCNDEMIEKIQGILKQVGLFSLYNTLPKGMDTNMTRYFEEDGILLSGGQMQKFSLTRALVSNREILILDEPTSALDAIAEYEFYEKINHEFKDKTILFISHRLASTDFCEEIFLIEDKIIKERGTHKYLMSLNGRYKELFEIQAKNYKEEVGQ